MMIISLVLELAKNEKKPTGFGKIISIYVLNT